MHFSFQIGHDNLSFLLFGKFGYKNDGIHPTFCSICVHQLSFTNLSINAVKSHIATCNGKEGL